MTETQLSQSGPTTDTATKRIHPYRGVLPNSSKPPRDIALAGPSGPFPRQGVVGGRGDSARSLSPLTPADPQKAASDSPRRSWDAIRRGRAWEFRRMRLNCPICPSGSLPQPQSETAVLGDSSTRETAIPDVPMTWGEFGLVPIWHHLPSPSQGQLRLGWKRPSGRHPSQGQSAGPTSESELLTRDEEHGGVVTGARSAGPQRAHAEVVHAGADLTVACHFGEIVHQWRTRRLANH